MALNDQFHDVEPVAAGPPGTVWRARRREGDEVVAVTELDREVADQAPRVAVRLSQVDDPHIVRVLDVTNDGARTLLVEQWVDGATLARVMDEGEISAQHAIAIVVGVLDALAVAHENGVAHGDLRPELVLIDPSGSPRLLGFGLGLPIPGTTVRGNTGTIAPEVARGQPADPRSDIYSTGCLLFWLLTGRPPFPRDRPSAEIDAHLRNPMPWLPGAPSDIRQIVRAAMAKDPATRYATANEMADALHAAASRRYGDGWDDLSSLAARAAGIAAELGAAAARSQQPLQSLLGGPLRLATSPAAASPKKSERAAAAVPPTTVLPAGAAPEDAAPLEWSATAGRHRDLVGEEEGTRDPVLLERARAAREETEGPRRGLLAVLAVIIALAAFGGFLYLHYRPTGSAGPSAPLPEVQITATGPVSAGIASPIASVSPGPPAVVPSGALISGDLTGTWHVTDTVTAVKGTILGPKNAPLRKGQVVSRTYELTQRCSSPGICTLTLLDRDTSAFLGLTGDGHTFKGSVTNDKFPCSASAVTTVTASITVTITSVGQGGQARSFEGSYKQTYAATSACAAAESTSTIAGVPAV